MEQRAERYLARQDRLRERRLRRKSNSSPGLCFANGDERRQPEYRRDESDGCRR
jgi:hypothetical protein